MAVFKQGMRRKRGLYLLRRLAKFGRGGIHAHAPVQDSKYRATKEHLYGPNHREQRKSKIHDRPRVAQSTAIKKNDIRVCFIQKGLFQAIEKARVPVMESLRRSFAYCQEDEAVLALEKTLEQLQEEMVRFNSRTRDVDWLKRNSIRFRWFVKKEEETFSRMNEIMDYMESEAYQERAEALCMAFLALSMTL